MERRRFLVYYEGKYTCTRIFASMFSIKHKIRFGYDEEVKKNIHIYLYDIWERCV